MTEEIKSCPHCKVDFDGGDIYESLRAHHLYKDKTDEEVREIASNYGWSPETPRRFSRLITVKIQGTRQQYYQCPDCKEDVARIKYRSPFEEPDTIVVQI